MIVANFVTNRATMGDTRTYEDFYKFLGTKPTRLGVVSRLYPELTASYLTESLRNIFYMDSKSNNKYRSIDSMYFEWEVETNYIKRVEFADVPTETGENGTEIVMAFKENYYQKYDIFKIDKTMQQCFVTQRPVRKADNYWEVTVRLIDNDYSSVLDLSGCQIGDTTRFQSNAMPEAHEEGYVNINLILNVIEDTLLLTDVMIVILLYMLLKKMFLLRLEKVRIREVCLKPCIEWIRLNPTC